jgi:GTPase SAR1 family protein
MKVIENEKLDKIPLITQNVDNTAGCAYKVAKPLEAINSFSYIVGAAGSGKTSLFLAMLCSRPTKKKPDLPRFYYKYFDKIYLISSSLASLPLNKLNLNEGRVHNKYSDALMQSIVETESENEENDNCLLILDDVIKDIRKSTFMSKCILNRRHILTNPEGEGCAGCSVWILSQRYNELPLTFRVNASSIYVFRTENKRELDAIKDELMSDLTKEQQNEVLKLAWNDKYSFLLILNNKPTAERYYQMFNKIVINEESKD